MTQSAPVKKKKKTKNVKPKNDESNVNLSRPATPMDKRKVAENNLREMIREAHQMHKNHNRYLKEMSTPTSRETIRKFKDLEKPEKKISQFSSIEMMKTNNRIKKGDIEKSSSFITATQKKLSEKLAKNNSLHGHDLMESTRKKIESLGYRQESEEFQIKKKVSPILRGQSAGFPGQKRVDVLPRQGSADYPATRKQGHETREYGKENRERSLKVKDYKIGSFVSLEVLDLMKCHESDTRIRTRKGIMRHSRQENRKSKEMSGNSSEKIGRKSRVEEKRKKENSVKENKVSTNKVTGEKKSNPKNILSSKEGNIKNSVSAPVKNEKESLDQITTVITSPKSDSSNLDSNLSIVTGAGDIFSSNTSRTYFSSDSDISKIDKKFMEILEAVTRTKIDFEEREKRIIQEKTNNANDPSTSGINSEEIKIQKPSELEQLLLNRISYLEQKLEQSSLEDNMEKRKDIENTQNDDVSTLTKMDEFRKKKNQNNPTNPVGDKKSKDDVTSKIEKVLKSHEGRAVQDVAQSPKPSPKPEKSGIEIKPTKVSEVAKVCTKDDSKKESIKKRMRCNKQSKKTPEKKGSTESADVEVEKEEGNTYKRVETWSIIKRLEKALQTLGLNTEDLENSDEEVNSSAEKKLRIKKPMSSGQEKRGLPQSETLRRCQEAVAASRGTESNAFVAENTATIIESNGSGDKNTEYKQVRSSKKMEDLANLSRGKNYKVKTQKEPYYTSMSLLPRIKVSEECNLNGLSEGKYLRNIRRKSSRKRSDDYDEKQMTEYGANSHKSKTEMGELLSSKMYGKRSLISNTDDGCKSRGKSKSVYSLSVSYSESSLSDENCRSHKRKKKNHLLIKESSMPDKEIWTNTDEKGDTMSQTLLNLRTTSDRIEQLERKYSMGIKKNTSLNEVQVSMKKPQKIFKMEEKDDELQLKKIRQRRKKIISDIKLSLEEIKRQHNLCTKLRRQTKLFNRDCHAKRRMLTSYLKDVEKNYGRSGRSQSRDAHEKHWRALSNDSYNTRRNTKMRRKHSDCDMRMLRLQKYEKDDTSETYEMDEIVLSMFETDNETIAASDDSSMILQYASTEVTLTDSVEGSYRSIASSLPTICQRYRPKKGIQKEDSCMEMTRWQWKGKNKYSFSEDNIKQGPNYLVHLLKKLNRIILTEKSQVKDLVVKASTSSNLSNQSNKAKFNLSGKSSRSSVHMKQNNKSSALIRPMSTEYGTCTTNLFSNGSPRQHKSKGNRKNDRDNSPEAEDIPITRSRSFIRGDPGGRSFESLIEQERENKISESYPTNRLETMLQCGTSCIHLAKHAEEHRYRKGDPSFRAQSLLLQQLDEHSRHCVERAKENDDSWKRKLELERILHGNEKIFKRTNNFDKDAQDSDSYFTLRGRQASHGRHRQQSIIDHNDHSRGEENEESQTVLGHASRHSGVAFGLRKHNRKVPHEYIKIARKRESNHLGRLHEFLKKGKRNHMEDVPINFYDISTNTPGSSSGLKDAYCQTDNIEEYEDTGEIYLLEEFGSSPSLT